ncbi:MAG: AI-2E family transporter [Bacteroidia bacterium]
MVRLPLYLKLSQVTLGLLGFFYILYIGQEIIVPLIFSLILAILLNPVVNFFTKRKFNRVLSIMIAIVLLLCVVGGIFYFIGAQASMFSDSWPELKLKFNELLTQALSWFSETFHVGKVKIDAWMTTQKDAGMTGASGMIGNTITSVSSALVVVLLIPVYIFLYLFYKPLLLQFIAKLFESEQHKVVSEVLHQTRTLIQNYLVGLLIEMAIVATMNSVALLIIGVKYAILLGVIGAILNLIPYIGGVIAIALPMTMALITGDPHSAIFVLLAYLLIQLIDNNFLVPKIVASKVKVNALVSVIVVLIGGALWGVSGMFLAIPLTAIIKVIFDKIQGLEAYGFLIGDTMPEIGKAIFTINLKTKK